MKKLIYILLLPMALLLLPGCKKSFLDTNPSSAMSKDEAVSNITALNGIVDGINNMMYMYTFGQFFGDGAPSLNAQLDMLGDDVINSMPALFMGSYRWEDHRDIYGSINFNAWDFYYTLIQHANTVIEASKNIEVTPSEEPLRLELLGEAHAFRAYALGNLVQLFGKRYVKGGDNSSLGVILRLDANYDPMPRSTVEETYTQINKDLDAAIENLSKGEKFSNRKNRLSLSAAYGIAARIALAQQNWEKAKEYASMAIQSKPAEARLATGAELTNGFNDWSCPEWIWAYKQADDQNLYYNAFGAHYAYNFNGKQWGLRYAINRDIFDPMGPKDVRRNWFVCQDLGNKPPKDSAPTYFSVDQNSGDITWETTGQFIKFANKSSDGTFMDLVIMRLGEFYYIKAEAEARLGDDASARKTLNTVMQTRDEDYDCSKFSGDELLNEIFRNKRVDLVFEGVRFFDMKRTGTLVKRIEASNAKYMTAIQKKTFIERNSGKFIKSIAKTKDAKEWQFVIPYSELKGNKLCKQNEL